MSKETLRAELACLRAAKITKLEIIQSIERLIQKDEEREAEILEDIKRGDDV